MKQNYIKLKRNILRISFLILLLSSVTTMAVAQDNNNISFSSEEMSLADAFEQIEQQTQMTVAYNENVIDSKKIVSTEVSGALSKVLQHILKGTNTTYKIQDKQIIIVKAEVQRKEFQYTGTIVDDAKVPLIGVTVFVEGTTQGATTGVDGSFSINALEQSTLTVSYIGFATQNIVLGAQTNLTITLKEDTQKLDEVVVIGYGVTNKRDVSTAIVSVKSDALMNVPISDFRQGLSGKMAGVQVIQTSGDPEGSVSIKIRGTSTITAGSEPLYIIDGIPVSRGLANINSNDIESVEVLKDASSAAIYGSRGSNGVILVTTKRGRGERLTVSYDGYYGVQSVSKKIDMMDAYQFALAAKDGHDNAHIDANPGGTPDDPNSERPDSWGKVPPILFPYLDGEAGLTNTDWQDAIFRTSSVTSHNVSLSGQGKSVNYFISGNYYKNEGVVINTDFEKYSARLNLDGKQGKFKYGINFSPSYSVSNKNDTSGSRGVVQNALMSLPIFPVYNEDGSFNFDGNGLLRTPINYQHNATRNPVAMAYLDTQMIDRMALVGKAFASYEFIKGLTYQFSIGGDFYGAYNSEYQAKELPLRGEKYYATPSPGEAKSSSAFYFNWVVENQISYNTTIADDHNISAIIVQSAQKETHKSNGVESGNFPNDYLPTIGAGIVTKGESATAQWSLASYLARVQYSYKGKYMVSAAIRADGSSRFGADNRWGYFPSVSAAWRVSDEPFLKWDAIDDLKIRASYGVTGNFNIGNYAHLALMSGEDYVLNDELQAGYKPDGVGIDDLRWEKNHMANVGIDLLMFKGYFGFTADLYSTNTTDMLLTVPVPHLSGHSSTLMNIGEVNNKGIELQLTSQQSFKSGLSYNFSANFSRNINEVIALGPSNAPIIASGGTSHAFYKTEVGQPIGSYYLLVQDGIFANEEELKSYPHFVGENETQVGDFRYVDVDGDGVLDLDKDRAIVGNYMPDFTYGFSGGVDYKGVDFSFSFQGSYGSEILNLNQRYINNQEGNVNGMVEGIHRWRSEEEPGNRQINRGNRKATGYNARTSTFHIEDGSYLRLQNITLGYTLPARWTNKILISRLRVYVSGQNLWTVTGYSGYNPEVSNRSSATTPGEDYGTYPLAKVVSVGLNVTF